MNTSFTVTKKQGTRLRESQSGKMVSLRERGVYKAGARAAGVHKAYRRYESVRGIIQRFKDKLTSILDFDTGSFNSWYVQRCISGGKTTTLKFKDPLADRLKGRGSRGNLTSYLVSL